MPQVVNDSADADADEHADAGANSPPPLIEVVIEDVRWDRLDLALLADAVARATFAALGLPRTGFQAAILACDDSRIAGLNADFRGKPVPTNVLSWPAEELAAANAGDRPRTPEAGDADDPEYLGDIALGYETCLREAEQAGIPFSDHVAHLGVHGLLHLLGYDHVCDADADLMEKLEQRILAQMGIPDPYQVSGPAPGLHGKDP